MRRVTAAPAPSRWGASTVDGRVAYEPVNSCILLLGMVDGTEIVTVEDLASSNGRLHPVQRALVDAHASQCGFCTPGFVMSLFTLYHAGRRADRAAVNDWLAGNLCRCTGYRPIADAALACCTGEADDAFTRRAAETASQLAKLSNEADVFAGNGDTFFAAPATEDALAALCARYPDATIVGGATDVGLWITKQLRELPRIVHTGRVASLHEVREMDDRIEIGAAATYTEAEAGARRHRSGCGRDAAPPGLEAGAKHRHVGGEHRQRLADRRFAAVLIALGRLHRAAPPQCPPDAGAGGFLPRLRAPGSRPRRDPHPHQPCCGSAKARHFAATRSRSASTRTSPPCSGRSASASAGGVSPRRASPTAAWPPPQARPRDREHRRRPSPARSRILVRRRRSACRGLLAHRRSPRERPLSPACGAVPAHEGAHRDRRPPHRRDADHRHPRNESVGRAGESAW